MEINANNTFFTADLHLFHKNVIKYCNRPFDNVEEMNEAIVKNWNEKVPKNSNVFILGDVGFAPFEKIYNVVSRLNGKKYLIRGNHDKQIKGNHNHPFVWIKDLETIKVLDRDLKHKKQKIVLCHYSMNSWDCQHHGAWNLFGHSHGQCKDNKPLSMDVGVDCHNFTPISYKEIKEIFNEVIK